MIPSFNNIAYIYIDFTSLVQFIFFLGCVIIFLKLYLEINQSKSTDNSLKKIEKKFLETRDHEILEILNKLKSEGNDEMANLKMKLINQQATISELQEMLEERIIDQLNSGIDKEIMNFMWSLGDKISELQSKGSSDKISVEENMENLIGLYMISKKKCETYDKYFKIISLLSMHSVEKSSYSLQETLAMINDIAVQCIRNKNNLIQKKDFESIYSVAMIK